MTTPTHDLIEALELRDARFEEILEWVREVTEVGTAYQCECGHSTYHRFNKECENCGREFPFLDLLCFKLGANVPDEDSPARQALAAQPEPRLLDDESELGKARSEWCEMHNALTEMTYKCDRLEAELYNLKRAAQQPDDVRERVHKAITDRVSVKIRDTDAVCGTCRGRGGHLKECEHAGEPWPTQTVHRDKTVEQQVDAVLAALSATPVSEDTGGR